MDDLNHENVDTQCFEVQVEAACGAHDFDSPTELVFDFSAGSENSHVNNPIGKRLEAGLPLRSRISHTERSVTDSHQNFKHLETEKPPIVPTTNPHLKPKKNSIPLVITLTKQPDELVPFGFPRPELTSPRLIRRFLSVITECVTGLSNVPQKWSDQVVITIELAGCFLDGPCADNCIQVLVGQQNLTAFKVKHTTEVEEIEDVEHQITKDESQDEDKELYTYDKRYLVEGEDAVEINVQWTSEDYLRWTAMFRFTATATLEGFRNVLAKHTKIILWPC